MTIEEFKKTDAYKDIRYMTKHVPYPSVRCSILKEMGYKVKFCLLKTPSKEIKDNISIDKKGKIKYQISYKINNTNYAWFVVI